MCNIYDMPREWAQSDSKSEGEAFEQAIKRIKPVDNIHTAKEIIEERACPICGKTFTERPAVLREDSYTIICPDCGIRQALASLGVDSKEQDAIIKIIHEKAR